jgi:hypothetical protein
MYSIGTEMALDTYLSRARQGSDATIAPMEPEPAETIFSMQYGGGLRSSEHRGAVPCSRSDATAVSSTMHSTYHVPTEGRSAGYQGHDAPPNLAEMVATQPTDSAQTECAAGVRASPVLKSPPPGKPAKRAASDPWLTR